MKSVIIIGASGHGKVVADIIQKSGDKILGFLDDNTELEDIFMGFPILGTINDYEKYKDVAEFVVAIGDASIRRCVSRKLQNVRIYTAIHPSAVISSLGVSIGKGTVVMANSVINSGSQIGEFCIINTGAIVEHDNIIEDFVHVSVGAKLAGTVCIGKNTWIGIGAVVSNNLKICENCVIRAGAVVVENIVKSGNYQGVPAKIKE
ncbi:MULTISPECIES: acetyltransferase [Clostridia]|uniref:acetyltransferase n=1 Tax=Clostridia TaxID=186801 RepID=UPI000E4DF8DC|nr:MULTISPECIES: acetyltransferase [Clostridia]RHV70467.1 sialic acid O-acetyltransferase NeuD family sugar O-acyltransferase [Roseburia sp. OM02-15]